MAAPILPHTSCVFFFKKTRDRYASLLRNCNSFCAVLQSNTMVELFVKPWPQVIRGQGHWGPILFIDMEPSKILPGWNIFMNDCTTQLRNILSLFIASDVLRARLHLCNFQWSPMVQSGASKVPLKPEQLSTYMQHEKFCFYSTIGSCKTADAVAYGRCSSSKCSIH